MTPGACLTAVIARLVAAGLTQALSPLGVRNQANQVIDQSFSVTPVSVSPSPSPDRSKANVAGVRVEQVFDIQLGHKVRPTNGLEAPSTALGDLHTTLKYLAAGNTSLTQGTSIRFGPSTMSFAGSGAFLIQSFSFSVTYNLTLVI